MDKEAVVGVMKLGMTLAFVRVGVVAVVDCFIGDDLASSEIRRRLFIGDGMICLGFRRKKVREVVGGRIVRVWPGDAVVLPCLHIKF